MYNCLDKYRRVTDGRTDGQRSCHGTVRAMHTRRAKNRTVCSNKFISLQYSPGDSTLQWAVFYRAMLRIARTMPSQAVCLSVRHSPSEFMHDMYIMSRYLSR